MKKILLTLVLIFSSLFIYSQEKKLSNFEKHWLEKERLEHPTLFTDTDTVNFADTLFVTDTVYIQNVNNTYVNLNYEYDSFYANRFRYSNYHLNGYYDYYDYYGYNNYYDHGYYNSFYNNHRYYTYYPIHQRTFHKKSVYTKPNKLRDLHTKTVYSSTLQRNKKPVITNTYKKPQAQHQSKKRESAYRSQRFNRPDKTYTRSSENSQKTNTYKPRSTRSTTYAYPARTTSSSRSSATRSTYTPKTSTRSTYTPSISSSSSRSTYTPSRSSSSSSRSSTMGRSSSSSRTSSPRSSSTRTR